MMNFKAITLGAIALTLAPLTPAAADSPYRGPWRGYHHLGLGGVIADVIVGALTLPLVIAAAVVDPPTYLPPINYSAPPPAAYYDGYAPYYRPPARYYAPPARYYGYRGYRTAPRQGHYPYRR